MRALKRTGGERIAGAFLVAPPGEAALAELPEVDPAFRPYPTDPLTCRSLLVASHDDPYANIEETATLSAAWGSAFVDAGNAGHINVDSGHGPWPEGLMTFGGFLSRLVTRRSGPPPDGEPPTEAPGQRPWSAPVAGAVRDGLAPARRRFGLHLLDRAADVRRRRPGRPARSSGAR